MKLSAGFNARLLRDRPTGKWRGRLCRLLCAVLVCLGLLLLAQALTQLPPLLTAFGPPAVGIIGVLLILIGIAGWRKCRRRPQFNGLDMAPGLLKSR